MLENQPVPLVGILSERMRAFKNWEMAKGEYLLDDRNVVIGFGIAEQFKLGVGDTVRVRGAEFTVSGLLEEIGNRDETWPSTWTFR